MSGVCTKDFKSYTHQVTGGHRLSILTKCTTNAHFIWKPTVYIQSTLVCNIFLSITYLKPSKCQKQFCKKSSRVMPPKKGFKIHANILHFFWLSKILWGPRTSLHNKINPTTQELLCVGKWRKKGQAELYFMHWLHAAFKHLLNSTAFGDFNGT